MSRQVKTWFCCHSIQKHQIIGLVWNLLTTCDELTRQHHKLWQFWRFCSRKYCKPFQVDFSQTNENFNKQTSLSCMHVTKTYQSTKYGWNWILSCVCDLFDPYWDLLLRRVKIPKVNTVLERLTTQLYGHESKYQKFTFISSRYSVNSLFFFDILSLNSESSPRRITILSL